MLLSTRKWPHMPQMQNAYILVIPTANLYFVYSKDNNLQPRGVIPTAKHPLPSCFPTPYDTLTQRVAPTALFSPCRHPPALAPGRGGHRVIDSEDGPHPLGPTAKG